jgi:hypothetical protein
MRPLYNRDAVISAVARPSFLPLGNGPPVEAAGIAPLVPVFAPPIVAAFEEFTVVIGDGLRRAISVVTDRDADLRRLSGIAEHKSAGCSKDNSLPTNNHETLLIGRQRKASSIDEEDAAGPLKQTRTMLAAFVHHPLQRYLNIYSHTKTICELLKEVVYRVDTVVFNESAAACSSSRSWGTEHEGKYSHRMG